MSGRKWQQSSTPQAHGKIASEMTLGEAIVRGILPEPKYVIAMYSYKKELDQALTKEQQEQLAALGMIWDRNTEKWEEYFEAAQEYYRQHGNLDVMAKYVTEEGLPLGRWLSDISNKVSDENLRRVSLTDEQLERLKSIGFKQEKKTARQWNEKYELAKNYYEIHGDLNVPLSYCVNDVKLGRWISNIRSKRKHPGSNGMALSQERIRQLDNIGMNWK
ncbi:MAG: helicase associated domain-containing protein [Ruminococcus sp.]|nr:helicase associated domain-containing protein [Ruminococcus sp.]